MTGGYDVWDTIHLLAEARSEVQVYNTSGEGEMLPVLNTARMDHACGHYIRDDKVVTI